MVNHDENERPSGGLGFRKSYVVVYENVFWIDIGFRTWFSVDYSSMLISDVVFYFRKYLRTGLVAQFFWTVTDEMDFNLILSRSVVGEIGVRSGADLFPVPASNTPSPTPPPEPQS